MVKTRRQNQSVRPPRAVDIAVSRADAHDNDEFGRLHGLKEALDQMKMKTDKRHSAGRDSVNSTDTSFTYVSAMYATEGEDRMPHQEIGPNLSVAGHSSISIQPSLKSVSSIKALSSSPSYGRSTGLERALMLLPLLSEALKDAQSEQKYGRRNMWESDGAGLDTTGTRPAASQEAGGGGLPRTVSGGRSGSLEFDLRNSFDREAEEPQNVPKKGDSGASMPSQEVTGSAAVSSYPLQSISLLPCWSRADRPHQSIVSKASGAPRGGQSDMTLGSSFMNVSMTFWDKYLVSDPNSAIRVCWDLACCLVLAYDFIVIPLELIGLSGGLIGQKWVWITPTFWSLDMCLSFFRGYLAEEGFIERRLTKTICRYSRGWFMFDLMVIIIDWLSFMSRVGVDFGDGELALSLLRFLRLLRVARALKLFSAIKMLQRLQTIVQGIHSEALRLFLGIIKLVCAIMFMNHLVACGWYAVGTFDQDWDDSWVRKRDMANKSFAYRYMTALHWSLTQFTPSGMEVHPENAVERAYAISVVLVGMFMFSALVSNVTSSMMRYRMQNSGRVEAHMILRRYLDENHVTMALSSRIIRYVLLAERRVGHARTHEQDVAVLKLLPRRLRSELHTEVCGPWLGNHPFFRCFSVSRPGSTSFVYDRALEEVNLPFGQELFEAGEVAESMYFVVMGTMRYHGMDESTHAAILGDSHARINIMFPEKQNPSSDERGKSPLSKAKTKATINVIDHALKGPPKDRKAPWVSEACLWLKWQHVGHLAAEVMCEIIGIRAAAFQELLAKEMPSYETHRYAHKFAAYYQARPQILTDLPSPDDVLEDFCKTSFGEAVTMSVLGLDVAPQDQWSCAITGISTNTETTLPDEIGESPSAPDEVTLNVKTLRDRPLGGQVRAASLRSDP